MLALLQRWLDEEAQKITDMTPLHLFMTYGNAMAVQRLLEAGANQRIAIASGVQPMLSATERLKQTQDEPMRRGYERVGKLSMGLLMQLLRTTWMQKMVEQLLWAASFEYSLVAEFLA